MTDHDSRNPPASYFSQLIALLFSRSKGLVLPRGLHRCILHELKPYANDKREGNASGIIVSFPCRTTSSFAGPNPINKAQSQCLALTRKATAMLRRAFGLSCSQMVRELGRHAFELLAVYHKPAIRSRLSPKQYMTL